MQIPRDLERRDLRQVIGRHILERLLANVELHGRWRRQPQPLAARGDLHDELELLHHGLLHAPTVAKGLNDVHHAHEHSMVGLHESLGASLLRPGEHEAEGHISSPIAEPAGRGELDLLAIDGAGLERGGGGELQQSLRLARVVEEDLALHLEAQALVRPALEGVHVHAARHAGARAVHALELVQVDGEGAGLHGHGWSVVVVVVVLVLGGGEGGGGGGVSE